MTEQLTGPAALGRPAFLMNAPFGYTAEVANNVWMEEYAEGARQVDQRRAIAQWMDLYNLLASEGLVYVLPTPPEPLQDLVFTANLGIALTHLKAPTVVLSRFVPGPREGETLVGERFFKQMGYDVHLSPHEFEGEAELKHLRDNVYVGGYGQRSTLEAYEWMESEFDMVIVKLAMTEPKLYHLDCSVFPLTPQHTMIAADLYQPEEIDALKAHTEIVGVSNADAMAGICNTVRLSNTLVNASHVNDLTRKTDADEYAAELEKNRTLEDIAEDFAFEVNYVNLSEYHKAGALLSCMVMHLNRHSYSINLL